MKKPRILIVEDEALIAYTLSLKLQAYNYEIVATVATGTEAIQITSELRPDIVLMGINLKGEIDGVEAAQQIRLHQHIPIIYITAHDAPEILQQAKATRPSGYILKPFRDWELHSSIEIALYNYAQEQALRLSEARLEALWQLSQLKGASLKEITDFALEAAIDLTHSEIGFIGLLNEDASDMSIHTWSRNITEVCSIEQKSLHLPVAEAGLWSVAIDQRKAVIINNYAGDHPQKKGYPQGHVALNRIISLPVFEGMRIVALVAIGNKATDYDDSDIRQLTLLMDGMWQHIKHQEAENALRKHSRNLALLNQAGQAFSASLELDRVFNNVLVTVRETLGVLDASIWLQEPGTQALVCQYVANPDVEEIRGWRVMPGQGFVGWVAQHGEPLVVHDTQHDPRHFKDVDQHTGVEIRSLLALPLWEQDRVIGVLEVVDTTPYRFSQDDLQLMTSLAATASIAIRNAHLYQQTKQDALVKTELLREVNHRVGNNLTAIMGMLGAERTYAQASFGQVEIAQAVTETLARIRQRVEGLAVAHRILSGSGWQPIQLSDLATQIIHLALHNRPPHREMYVDISPSPVTVSPRQASNLAPIINELVVNTLKHAVDDRKQGRIVVSIEQDAAWINFEYRDDGPGYPKAILEGQQPNVGMYLLHRLTKALRGTLQFANDGGAVATLQFKSEEGSIT